MSFVLISMANSLEIDLTEVLKKIWPNLTSGIAIALKERMGKHMIKIIVAGFKDGWAVLLHNGLRNRRL